MSEQKRKAFMEEKGLTSWNPEAVGGSLYEYILELETELTTLQSAHDKLKEENVKLAEDYLTAETQKIIAQEKYDKLKEENANLGATNETAALTGWICPSCDNSNHPFVTICSCGDAKK